MRSQEELTRISDRTSHVSVTIEVNCHGESTTTHTEEYTGVHYLRVADQMATAIKECVCAVFGQYGAEDARLVFGILKQYPLVKESVVVNEGEEAPEGAMVVNIRGELLNSEDGM